MNGNPAKTVDKYVDDFPDKVKSLLNQMRTIIKNTAPDAIECISYGIATYKLGGNLVHFGGYKTHIGFYPGPGAIKTFAHELSDYKTAKGTIQFPLDKPLPLDLIAAITNLCVEQNLKKMQVKAKKAK